MKTVGYLKRLAPSGKVKTAPSPLSTLLLACMEGGMACIEKRGCEFSKEKTAWETLFI